MKHHRMALCYGRMASIIYAATFCCHASAQATGSTTVSVGWLHVAPQGDATPLTVQSIGGVAVNQQLAGSGAHPTSSDTVGITTEYCVTDNIGVAMLLGLPLKVNLVGDGTLQKYGNLGSTKPMPPAIELRYHLFQPSRNSVHSPVWASTMRGSPRFGFPIASLSLTTLDQAVRHTRNSVPRGIPYSRSGQITRLLSTGRSEPLSATFR